MKVLRTIETFFPYISGPANQAFQISNRLERMGISSPVLTTYCDVDPGLPAHETVDRVRVTRLPYQFRAMRYCVSAGMPAHLKDFDVLHSHNYRNFQTDCAFFLPAGGANPSSSTRTARCWVTKNISRRDGRGFPTRFTT